MPATAGRVRMPANNRVHSSAALQTHGIWQSAIGYDPYAPDQKQPPAGGTAAGDRDAAAARSAGAPSADQQNAYDSFQGLLALARLTGSNADEARGSCPKCGRVGHLPFQCRNFLVLKDKAPLAAAAASSLPGFVDRDSGGAVHRKGKGRERRRREEGSGRGDDGGKAGSDTSCEDQSSDDEDSDLTDSSEDSEMERAILAKYGKNLLKSSSHRSKLGHKKERSEATRHRRSHSKRSKSRKDASDDDDAISSEEQKKKGRHRSKPKRSRKDVLESGSDEDSSGSDGEGKRRRKRGGHSHKHGKSKSKRKHRDEQSDESSDGEDAKHAKKRRHGGQHRDRNHS